MLPKKYRLHKYRDFKKVWQSRLFLKQGDLKAQYLLNNKLGYPRMTVTVSNKVLPGAAKRNYFKRQIRALFLETVKNHPHLSIDLIISLNATSNPQNIREDYQNISHQIFKN